MAESVFDRINDYGLVRIQLASPNDIRSWSFGEVKKPETINYRTYRPEKDGLFCERIFGPSKDWECSCGKYKGTKHKGIICDRCGVKVTHSRVRRKRMGHINLAAPIVHIWFFKALPSRLATLLGMRSADLEKIIMFQSCVVTDPGDSQLKFKQVLSEDDFRAASTKYGDSFRASMGAEAIRDILEKMDLDEESVELRKQLTKTRSKQKISTLAKRLKLVESLRNSGNDPGWMIMDVIPVIPPDLRPLVMLESGNFATSDLNDLYRRIINRNNRLKKLMDLNAPEVIIRNEKRMLQQSVDALFDNNRCRRPVQGTANRPLKSLTDMIKGKQGRFRENLLGKRVDYSGRSVIVVGPELKLHQCGLPKKMALELYQPFIIRKLKERGLADTIKSAKKIIERRDAEIWDILEEVIYQHPVLLNRAPTLHRMGIQAFEPLLVEGNAIRLHPLVCQGFNADFDGDQMAVHLPMTVEAQAESHVLMMATNNIFSPADGRPIMSATQDMVLGIYFMTNDRGAKLVDASLMTVPFEEGHYPLFGNEYEAIQAYESRTVGIHADILLKFQKQRPIVEAEGQYGPEGGKIITTVGRVIFNDILPDGMPYYNYPISKQGMGRVVSDCYRLLGRKAVLELLDTLKSLGFHYATLAGISFGIYDACIPEDKKEILASAQKRVDKVEKDFESYAITDRERYNQIVDIWIHSREEITKSLALSLKTDSRDDDPNFLNPVHLMTDSGARGKIDQIRQLAGMRGLMAKPSGEIIETPIKANFREGLNVLEYFSSTHGARKGLADTALKTADSGYLTRKLADVAQNVIVNEIDCGTVRGISKHAIYKGEQVDVPLSEMIIGRVARETIANPMTDEVIVAENEIISVEAAAKIEDLGLDSINVRSPLTCESRMGVCARCYGNDLATGRLVEEGQAVGIIAAQSIGEPGTQLTMRTFHTGGTATRSLLESELVAPVGGKVAYRNMKAVPAPGKKSGWIPIKRQGEIAIFDDKDRELEKFKVSYGSMILVADGKKVKKGQKLAEWDPHRVPILAEAQGKVKFRDIQEGETVRIEESSKREAKHLVVIEHKGEMHPQIAIEDKDGNVLDVHYLPAKAHIEVGEGQKVVPGELLARQPREVTGTQDITGGLPRITEIFEARKPKEPAAMAEISGHVELETDKRRGKMTVVVRSESGMVREHHVPHDRHLHVHAGDYVEAGDPLTEGPLVPHDILKIRGESALYHYLLGEIQGVYRATGVSINDKHLEIILSQMMRKIMIDKPGDSAFLPGEMVDKFRFISENNRLAESLTIVDPGDSSFSEDETVGRSKVEQANLNLESEGKNPAKTRKPKPARAIPVLLGITKASLQSESFLSAASFQESTKVFTEASLAGKVDQLVGLKENVILGHLVPAGTGFKPYLDMRLKKEQPAIIDTDMVGEGAGEEASNEAALQAVQKALGTD